MSIDMHIYDRDQVARCRVAGLTGKEARLYVEARLKHAPQTYSVAVVLGDLGRKATAGHATGRYLVGIVRDNKLRTYLLTERLSRKALKVRHIV